jgi:hypothetical protein
MAILSKQIGWSNESNLLWEILKKLNRLAGIIGGLKPKYKVFTALVTQNGTENFVAGSYFQLVIGRTYRITNSTEGTDFTVVGAPNNNVNTYFIATGENAVWGIDAELEWDEGAPVATVLENTIGNVWFTYSGVGVYRLNSNNLFTVDKTMVIGNTSYDSANDGVLTFFSKYGNNSESSILLEVIDGGSQIDSVLDHTPLEIRVYN